MLEALQPLAPELLWLLGVSFVIAFLLAFSVGANDVSNSFGTAVGSRVLTVTQACILATFFEVAGATLLGYSVCDTFRRSIYDVKLYENSQKELMVGALACLVGSAVWNIVATALKMPISGTHSIIGATIGFSIVLRGWSSIKWLLMVRIVASWFISPLVSGTISSLIYILVSKTVICKIDPLKNGLKALPLFYGATIFINIASVVIDGPHVFGLNTLKWYHGLFISLVASGATICYVAIVQVPKMYRMITDEIAAKANQKGASNIQDTSLSSKVTTKATDSSTGLDNKAFRSDATTDPEGDLDTKKKELNLDPSRVVEDSKLGGSLRPPIAPKPARLTQLSRQRAQEQQLEEIDLSRDENKTKSVKLDIESGTKDSATSSGRPEMISGERFEVFRLFSTLQILTACFASFAHGSNDVSNAVAPLIPIWHIFSTGAEDINISTPTWILAFGGIGICTGLWAWGRAVMSTVGTGLTKLTPSKGFSIELGAAISVLFASKLGFPISTTHCKIGSLVIVGLVSQKFLSQDNLLDMSPEEREKQAESNANGVDWKLFGNIAITWIVTVPLAALASAAFMVAFKWLLLESP